jgi:hypothetical protein
MGKIWGVWCKGVQCLVMSDLKHNKISNLRSLIITSLPLEYEEFFKRLNWRPHQNFKHLKQTNNEEDIRLELERCLKLICQKN